MKTDKEFKCIAFKHDAQLQIYREIKELTPEEEIKYFRLRAEASAFGKWWKKLQGETVVAKNMTWMLQLRNSANG